MRYNHPSLSEPRIFAFFDRLNKRANDPAYSDLCVTDLIDRAEAAIVAMGLAHLATWKHENLEADPDMIALQAVHNRLWGLVRLGDEIGAFSAAHTEDCEMGQNIVGQCQDEWLSFKERWVRLTGLPFAPDSPPTPAPIPFPPPSFKREDGNPATLNQDMLDQAKARLLGRLKDANREGVLITPPPAPDRSHEPEALTRLRAIFEDMPDMAEDSDEIALNAPLGRWRDMIEHIDRIEHEHRIMHSVLDEATTIIDQMVNPHPEPVDGSVLSADDENAISVAIFERAERLMPSLKHVMMSVTEPYDNE